MNLSYKPVVLFHASIERMNACHVLFEQRDYVMSAYLAGVAIECILQANAIRAGAAGDARHDLRRWLGHCPISLRHRINADAIEEWSLLVTLWDNGLRYLSKAGFLGYLRDKGANRGISGGPDSIIRENSRRIIKAADIIHKEEISLWTSSTRKS